MLCTTTAFVSLPDGAEPVFFAAALDHPFNTYSTDMRAIGDFE